MNEGTAVYKKVKRKHRIIVRSNLIAVVGVKKWELELVAAMKYLKHRSTLQRPLAVILYRR